jgi:hypothetical protein
MKSKENSCSSKPTSLCTLFMIPQLNKPKRAALTETIAAVQLKSRTLQMLVYSFLVLKSFSKKPGESILIKKVSNPTKPLPYKLLFFFKQTTALNSSIAK